MAEFKEPTRSLEDVMTRYAALQELREIWQLGLLGYEKIKPQYVSKADTIAMDGLRAALDLIDRQIDLMSNFDSKKFQLQRIVNDLPTAGKIATTERESTAYAKRWEGKVPPVYDDEPAIVDVPPSNNGA